MLAHIEDISTKESCYEENKQTLLVEEDNIAMINYLLKKLKEGYNVYAALNGNEAIKKIKSLKVQPDLIITDVMMDKLDGYRESIVAEGKSIVDIVTKFDAMEKSDIEFNPN